MQVEYDMMEGAYHPHTASGTILVDHVAASCYTKHIQVLSTPFGNALFTPFKLMYKWLGPQKMEQFNTWILRFGLADSPAMAKMLSALHMVKYGPTEGMRHGSTTLC